MKNEFYHSTIDPFPTFSRVLAVSLVGLLPSGTLNSHSIVSSGDGNNPAFRQGIERCAHTYYMEANIANDEGTQTEALRRFAENLLRETKDSPQSLIDTLNRHFWELI